MSGRRDDYELAAQKRNRRDRRQALGAGLGAEGDVGATVLEEIGERRAGTGLDLDLQPVVARREGVDQRPDVLRNQVRGHHLHLPALAGRLVHRSARLLGQAKDLAGERQPAGVRRR